MTTTAAGKSADKVTEPKPSADDILKQLLQNPLRTAESSPTPADASSADGSVSGTKRRRESAVSSLGERSATDAAGDDPILALTHQLRLLQEQRTGAGTTAGGSGETTPGAALGSYQPKTVANAMPSLEALLRNAGGAGASAAAAAAAASPASSLASPNGNNDLLAQLGAAARFNAATLGSSTTATPSTASTRSRSVKRSKINTAAAAAMAASSGRRSSTSSGRPSGAQLTGFRNSSNSTTSSGSNGTLAAALGAPMASEPEETEAVRRDRKNSREKERRSQVNQMFDQLNDVLGLPSNVRLDKISLLFRAIETINTLRGQVRMLSNGTVEPAQPSLEE